jgi:Polyketide cyclase / dehydrase and lipid transport
MRSKQDFEAVVTGDADALWRVWSDINRFTEWDPREEESRLDGPFAVGTTGASKQKGYGRNTITLTKVDQADRCWEATTGLTGGRLVIDHRIIDNGDGTVRLAKHYTAHGPLSLLFRVCYWRRIRRELTASFAALAAEAALVRDDG